MDTKGKPEPRGKGKTRKEKEKETPKIDAVQIKTDGKKRRQPSSSSEEIGRASCRERV